MKKLLRIFKQKINQKIEKSSENSKNINIKNLIKKIFFFYFCILKKFNNKVLFIFKQKTNIKKVVSEKLKNTKKINVQKIKKKNMIEKI